MRSLTGGGDEKTNLLISGMGQKLSVGHYLCLTKDIICILAGWSKMWMLVLNWGLKPKPDLERPDLKFSIMNMVGRIAVIAIRLA